MFHDALAQDFELLCDALVGENSLNKQLQWVEKEQDSLLEELKWYKNAVRLEKALLGKKVAMKGMPRFPVEMERTVSCTDREKSLVLKTCKELLCRSWPTTTSGGRIVNKLLKHNPQEYLGFSFNVDKAVLKDCSREALNYLHSLLSGEKIESGEVKKWRKQELAKKMERYLRLRFRFWRVKVYAA